MPTESFEGLEDTVGSPLKGAFFQPGFQADRQHLFTFQSGLVLSGPVPNKSANGVFVGDFDRGFASWDLGNDPKTGNPRVVQPVDVPDGSAYLGLQGTPYHVDFSFGDAKPHYVSALVNAKFGHPPGGQIVMIAYAHNERTHSFDEIASQRISPAKVWKENKIELLSPKEIDLVAFWGERLVIDELFFGEVPSRTLKGTDGDDLFGAPPPRHEKKPHVIKGREGEDEICGGSGADTLLGGRHRDKIHGRDGNDVLIGGRGNDRLWGDDGQDSFMFRRLGSVDHLKDFDPNDDTIVLSAAHFGLKAGNLAGERFSDGASLPTAEARIIHDPVTGKLFLDRTGGDSGDAVLFAKLKPGLALDAEDFFVA